MECERFVKRSFSGSAELKRWEWGWKGDGGWGRYIRVGFMIFVWVTDAGLEEWWHGLQHARLPYTSLTSGACSNSCLASRWCHPAISSSIIPFFSCLQSFPAWGSFPVSQFFVSGKQSIGASASTSVQFSSVTQSCPTLCNLMECSMPGRPVHHQLPELPHTHVYGVGEAIQPSHPLLSLSPSAFNLSQHQGLF